MVGFNVPFGGAAADDAQSAAGVGHGMVLDGVSAVGVFVAGEAVFEDKGGDALIAEPFGEGITFVTEAEFGMAAAGGDDDGDASVGFGSREIGRNGGVVNVGDVAAFEFLGFGAAGFGAKGAVRPEREGGGWFGEEGLDEERNRREEGEEVLGHVRSK